MPDPFDLEVNRQVRKVLIRHWIDLGRVYFRSSQGVVTIRGTLERIAGVSEPLTGAIVEAIFGELNRVRDIKRITTDLTNWTQEGGMWRRTEAGPGAKPTDSARTGGTFQIGGGGSSA